jgi:hypothetical protein
MTPPANTKRAAAPASRVRAGHLPDWLRRRWLRATRRLRLPPHGTRGEVVFWQMETFLDHLAGRKGRAVVLLASWGSAVLGGRRCFVTGSPVNLIDLVNYLTPLADLLDLRMDLLAAGGRIAVVLRPPEGER